MNLITFMAQACYYSQDLIKDWEITESEREQHLFCTSYQIACFLAQNTVDGNGGVEHSIIMNDLCEGTKSEEEWARIIWKLVAEFGGLKKNEE